MEVRELHSFLIASLLCEIEGRRFKRKHWKDKYIFVQERYEGIGDTKFVIRVNQNGLIFDYDPTTEDVLCRDWVEYIIKEEKDNNE